MNTKKCSNCNEVKSLEEFHKNKARRDGFHNECRVCANARSKAYRAKPEHKQYHKQYHKQWYEEHKHTRSLQNKKLYRENRELKLSQNREWKQNNQDKCRSYFHKRKAIQLQADDGTLTHTSLNTLQKITHYCPCCGEQLTNEPGAHQKNISHIIPLAKGGAHGIDNVMILCRTCNLKQGDSLLTECDFVEDRLANDIHEFLGIEEDAA